MRAAIYARVSTSRQELDVQLAQLRAYAARQGWQVVVERADVASGVVERQALDAMERLARSGAVDVVLVAGLDRLGRSLVDVVTRVDRLSRAGVSLVSLREGFDFTSPAGRLQLGVLAAVAEFERELIAARTKAALERLRAQGRRFCRPRLSVDVELRPGETLSAAARRLGVSRRTVARRVGKRVGPTDDVPRLS